MGSLNFQFVESTQNIIKMLEFDCISKFPFLLLDVFTSTVNKENRKVVFHVHF